MMKIIQKIGAKRIAVVLVLFVVAFLSINVFSKAASNPENHTKTIESLDEKKADVLKLTAPQRRHLLQLRQSLEMLQHL